MGTRPLKDPTLDQRFAWELLKLADEATNHTRISAITTTQVMLLDPDLNVAKAAATMIDHGRWVAVVVDAHAHPLGVVWLHDVVKVVGEARSLHEVMQPCICLPSSVSVSHAAMSFVYERAELAVILAAGMTCGFVTRTEVFDWIAERSPRLREYRALGGLGAERGDVAPDDTTRGEEPPSTAEGLGPTEAVAEGSSAEGTSSVRIASRPPRRGTVVLVEDDRDIAAGTVDLLEYDGYDVVVARNGREALQALRSMPTRPGLILLDLMMPDMNGWEFRRRQVRDREIASVPVIVLTAFGHRVEREELLEPAGILRKPVPCPALLDAVSRHFDPKP